MIEIPINDSLLSATETPWNIVVYSRSTIASMTPLVSSLPSTVNKGFKLNYEQIPCSWDNQEKSASSFNVINVYEQLLQAQILKAQKDSQIVSLFCAFEIYASKSCT